MRGAKVFLSLLSSAAAHTPPDLDPSDWISRYDFFPRSKSDKRQQKDSPGWSFLALMLLAQKCSRADASPCLTRTTCDLISDLDINARPKM